MRMVELKRVKQFARGVHVGDAVIQVDAEELLAKLGGKTPEEKRQMLKAMGYEEYFDILRREEGFEWL